MSTVRLSSRHWQKGERAISVLTGKFLAISHNSSSIRPHLQIAAIHQNSSSEILFEMDLQVIYHRLWSISLSSVNTLPVHFRLSKPNHCASSTIPLNFNIQIIIVTIVLILIITKTRIHTRTYRNGKINLNGWTMSFASERAWNANSGGDVRLGSEARHESQSVCVCV